MGRPSDTVGQFWDGFQVLRVASSRGIPVPWIAEKTTERKNVMKRELLCGLLAAAFLSFPAQAARAVPVQADGMVLKSGSYVEQGVTYVPLRSLLDAMGGWDLRWDSQSATAVGVSGSRTLTAETIAINSINNHFQKSQKNYV